MNEAQVTKLRQFIKKDLDHLYGMHPPKLEITEISILGFGVTVQPYHQDDEGVDPPKDCEWEVRSGSLVYNLTKTAGEKCCLKVMTMGEGGLGYVSTTQVIHEDQALWFDDWVVHAGDVHLSSCVRLHVHVDLVENKNRRPKEVYVVSRDEVKKKYEEQKLFHDQHMKF